MRDPLHAPTADFPDDDQPEPDPGHGAMTLHIYRITAAGERIDLARLEVLPGESYWGGPISGEWPPCECPRCAPMLRSRLRRAGLC
ncbi:hypothetical protein [Kitasatospora sp. NBC_01266]|uniref:hypothetical protein n=1 Tax=Kitasatospora sp. NBC_01266 TaxID=2903572 RepID=UPI002E3267AD|nr:hypothetical protein [Kitasatospora sp. NBC_01266]